MKLNEYRKKKGWKQKDLRRELKEIGLTLSISSISGYEARGIVPTKNTMKKFYNFSNNKITPNDFYSFMDKKDKNDK